MPGAPGCVVCCRHGGQLIRYLPSLAVRLTRQQELVANTSRLCVAVGLLPVIWHATGATTANSRGIDSSHSFLSPHSGFSTARGFPTARADVGQFLRDAVSGEVILLLGLATASGKARTREVLKP